jgi:hypothetical protein
MNAKTKKTLMIVGAVAAIAAVGYVVLKPKVTAARMVRPVYVPTNAIPPEPNIPQWPLYGQGQAGNLLCSVYDQYGFGTRCF